MFPDLRTFLDRLRADGDLATVTAPVDAHLEVAEIHRRVIAADGPALLFTNVKGKAFPLVTNLFGTKRRAALAFGDRPLALVRRLVELAQTLLPPDPAKLWGARDVAGRPAEGRADARAGLGPVTEVVTPRAAARSAAGDHLLARGRRPVRHPAAGLHRVAARATATTWRCTGCTSTTQTSTGMHWQIGKGGGFHYAEAEAAGQAAAGHGDAGRAAGADPVGDRAAARERPGAAAGVADRRAAAGPGAGLVRPPASASSPPASSRCWARCRRSTRRPEGPFGDHYGYYSLRHDYPVFRVHTVAHRRDAIYPATVVGKPRQEDFYIGDLLQELLSPLFPLVMPAVEKLWSYGETGYHSLAAAVVKQRYPREAMASAFRILGEGQLSLQKFLLLTDRVVDVTDFRATLEHVLARTDPRTDLYVFGHLSMDTLDYTGPQVNRGSKGVWMGLGDPVRELPRAFAPPVPPPPDVTAVHVFCAGCLVVGAAAVRRGPRRRGSRLAAHPAFAGWPLLVVTDEPDAGGAQHGQLPVDHLHALRARRRHPRRARVARAQPRRVHAAGGDRRADQAVVSGRGVSGAPDVAEAGHAALARVLPRRTGHDGRCRARPSRLSGGSGCRTGGEATYDSGTSREQYRDPRDPRAGAAACSSRNAARRASSTTSSPTTCGSRTRATRRRSCSAATGSSPTPTATSRKCAAPGVVGETPVLEPGGSFEYTSYCPLTTAVGAMQGTYTMTTADGATFDAEIAPFTLAMPNALN